MTVVVLRFWMEPKCHYRVLGIQARSFRERRDMYMLLYTQNLNRKCVAKPFKELDHQEQGCDGSDMESHTLHLSVGTARPDDLAANEKQG